MHRRSWDPKPAPATTPPAMPPVGPSGTSRPIPPALGYTDEMVEAVCNAWTMHGPHPGYHRECQEWLDLNWPVLADAIRALVAGTTAPKDS